MDFLNNLYTVSAQVLILFILMSVGFACGKSKIFDDNSIKFISDFCLKFATPAVIIKSFMRKFEPAMGINLLYALLAAIICHALAILIASLVFTKKKTDPQTTALYRNSSVFSNAGFMGLPLQAALLGTIGTFYGAAYVVVFSLLLWTYAYATSSGGRVKLDFKKIVFNPGVIAVVIGLPIFLLSIELPEVLATSIGHIANLNTPLPMIVVGYYISKTNVNKMFIKGKMLTAIFMKLVFIPLVCLFTLYFIGFSGKMLVSTVISISAPIAVAITMFSAKFDGDSELSANAVSVSTLMSIVTMPLLVALASTL